MKKIKPCCLCGSEALRLWRAVIGDVRAWNKMRRPTKLLIGKAEETR